MSDRVRLKDIKPNPDNPRVILDTKFEKLVDSLLSFPGMLEKRGIVVRTGMALGGNQRLRGIEYIARMAPQERRERLEYISNRNPENFTEARLEAALAIWDEVSATKSMPASWVQRADTWTDSECREFEIRDNVHLGEWDFEALANHWNDIDLNDWMKDFDLMSLSARPEPQYSITLRYSEGDYQKVMNWFESTGLSKETAIINLLP